MQDENYFILCDFPAVQFVGFRHVTEFAYITIARSKLTIIVETKELPVRDNRFRVDLGNKRTTLSAQLYHLINHHELENRHFVYNQFSENYFASDIMLH